MDLRTITLDRPLPRSWVRYARRRLTLGVRTSRFWWFHLYLRWPPFVCLETSEGKWFFPRSR